MPSADLGLLTQLHLGPHGVPSADLGLLAQLQLGQLRANTGSWGTYKFPSFGTDCRLACLVPVGHGQGPVLWLVWVCLEVLGKARA